jgi:uncharacterized membrane protein
MPARVREAHYRSIAKAVSWRITGSIDTFVLSLLITGSFKFAGSIASVEMLTKIGLYYFHERAWHFIPWGRRQDGATDDTLSPVLQPVEESSTKAG